MTLLHCLQLLFPLPFPFPVISAASVPRGSTPSEPCANAIAVPVASLENPETETNFPSLTLSAILSREVFLTIHTLYLLLLLMFQENPISLLLFIFPLSVFLFHLILIGRVTPICLH